MTKKKEKILITTSVTIGKVTHTINFDLNSVDELTERNALDCYNCMGPTIVAVLRGKGKIVNPYVWD